MAMTNRPTKRVCLNSVGIGGDVELNLDMQDNQIVNLPYLHMERTGGSGSNVTDSNTLLIGDRFGAFQSSGNSSYLVHNAYLNPGWHRQQSGHTSILAFDTAGELQFYTGGSGSAGSTVTPVEKMSIGSSNAQLTVPLNMTSQKITALDAGTADTDAVNLSQIKTPYITKLQTSVQTLSGFGGLEFNTDVDSRGSWTYDAATGFFTIPEAGMYLVTVHVHLVSGNDTQISIATSDPAYTRAFKIYGSGIQFGDHVAMFALNAGAQIRATAYIASGTRGTSSTSVAYQNSISIAKIGE